MLPRGGEGALGDDWNRRNWPLRFPSVTHGPRRRVSAPEAMRSSVSRSSVMIGWNMMRLRWRGCGQAALAAPPRRRWRGARKCSVTEQMELSRTRNRLGKAKGRDRAFAHALGVRHEEHRLVGPGDGVLRVHLIDHDATPKVVHGLAQALAVEPADEGVQRGEPEVPGRLAIYESL